MPVQTQKQILSDFLMTSTEISFIIGLIRYDEKPSNPTPHANGNNV